jgi:hypothetical protein
VDGDDKKCVGLAQLRSANVEIPQSIEKMIVSNDQQDGGPVQKEGDKWSPGQLSHKRKMWTNSSSDSVSGIRTARWQKRVATESGEREREREDEAATSDEGGGSVKFDLLKEAKDKASVTRQW